MDFGYDEHGRRTAAHNEESDEEEPRVVAEAPHEGRPSLADSSASSSSNSSFGDDVELVIGETATQGIHEPLVEAAEVQPHRGGRRPLHGEKEDLLLLQGGTSKATLLLEDKARGQHTRTIADYLSTISSLPERLRNAAVIGGLHHGKTSLIEMLLLGGKPYTKRRDEKDRAMTLQSHVLTTVAGGQSLQPTSRLLTVVDTPGHPDFVGEVTAGVRLADAVLFCVDAVESVSDHAERLLRHAVLHEQLPVVLVITKLDKLIMDLKLPPLDAYRKLRLVIDSVNNIIASCGSGSETFLVSPERGTVCFSSVELGLFFSIETFALKYADVYPTLNACAFSKKLWGQVTFEKGAFKKITNFRQKPTFVSFVLEPLYKIVAHSVAGKGSEALSERLAALPRTPKGAVQEAIKYFCGAPAGEGLDVLLSVLPGTEKRSEWLCDMYGVSAVRDLEPLADRAVLACAPLLRPFQDSEEVAAVVRVMYGTLTSAAPVLSAAAKAAQNEEAPNKEEDGPTSRLLVVDSFSGEADPYYDFKVQGLYLRTADHGFVQVREARAGQTVYVSGLPSRSASHLVVVGGAPANAVFAEDDANGSSVQNSAGTEVSTDWFSSARLHPLGHATPLIHTAVECKDPAKAARMQQGLGLLLRTSPGLEVQAEETGEYTLSGMGELQLDTALHQLRRGRCPGVPVGISQPFVTFAETVEDSEGLLAMAGGRKNSIGCVAGQLSRQVVHALEYEQLSLFPTPSPSEKEDGGLRPLWTVLRRDYGFDALDARHIVALGPDTTKGTSLLINDTLEEEEMQYTLKGQHLFAITSAFRAAMASGPLVGGTVRGVAVKLITADMEPSTRDAVVLANARASMRHALFGARPRLLEPVLAAEILCSAECTTQLTEILRQRRGALLGEEPVAATTLVRARAIVPAMDSFGLETQIRMLTQGQAYPQFRFHQWDVVPGDPFDASIRVGPLEPAKGYQLSRDFVLKTRFRKGLAQNLFGDL